MKIWNSKNFWLKFFLPLFSALSLLVGLSIGIPMILRSRHPVASNVTIKLENPSFNGASPSNSSFNFNDSKYKANKYIEYWASGVHKMVPYKTSYSKVFNGKTLGDIIDSWNSEYNNKLFKIKGIKQATGLGRFLIGYLNPNKQSNDTYIPTKSQKKFGLRYTSNTNPNSKNNRHSTKFDPYSLDYETTKGIDALFMNSNDKINIINWPWKSF